MESFPFRSGEKLVPSIDLRRFSASDAFAPSVVIVMLGTNDAKPQNWAHSTEFVNDYRELIEHYRGLRAVVYVATPPHVFSAGAFDIWQTQTRGSSDA